MATSEPLVPSGLPYGERQQLTEAMGVAGLPRSVPTPGASPPSPTPAAGGGGSLEGFDVFAGREPSGVIPDTPPTTRPNLYDRVRGSNNVVMQRIFRRMAGYKEG